MKKTVLALALAALPIPPFPHLKLWLVEQEITLFVYTAIVVLLLHAVQLSVERRSNEIF